MAKRSQFYAVATDAEGNSLEDITVTVYDVGTTNEATIYSNRSGGGSIPSSFETDADGEITFWADPGSYDVVLEDSIIPARITEKTITWDAISGDVLGISGTQIELFGIGAGHIALNVIGPDQLAAPTIHAGTLGSDAVITTGGTYYNGPQVQVTNGTGVYDVRGYQKISNGFSSSVNVTFNSRIVPFGDSPMDTKEANIRAGSTPFMGFPFTHSRFVSLTNNQVVLLQGTCNIGSVASIEADGAYITATRVS
jgi:hypothetical protein